MKKVSTFCLAIIFIMLSASLALSAETTFQGEFRIQAWSEWNFDKKWNDITDEQYDGWFEQRFRLTITHTSSEYLKAVVQLDLVEDTWGQGRAMYINNNANGEYINWAYLDFTLPSIGNFRVGKFPVTWGHGMTLSQEHPGVDGIEWSKAWGPVSLALLYSKVQDNVTNGPGGTYNQDGNLFAAKIAYTPAENHLIELFGAYYNDHDYSVNNAFWGALGAIDVNAGFVALAYTGNIADMIDIKFEGNYLFGNAKTNLGAPFDKVDIEGWNIYLDVSYYNDLWRLGVAFLMKSGNDDFLVSNDDFNLCCFADEAFAWANIIGGDGGGNNSIYSGSYWSGDNLENITSVKLYFEICPMDKLTISAAVIWAKFTEDVGPGSWYQHPADYYGNWAGAYGWADDDDLGWEVDLGFSYEIMEGLTYTFAGGVLFTGDAWDYNAGAGPVAIHKNWGNIWSISNTLLYEF